MWAQVAWKYVQGNTNVQTGLVNGVDGESRASMWDVADYLAALLAARRFKLVDEKEFDERLSKLLDTLNLMPLVGEALPNRLYDTKTRLPVNDLGNATTGSWSAVDVGRLLLWLRITRQRVPEFSEYIDRVVLRWDVCAALDEGGNLMRGDVSASGIKRSNYPRLGYQQYAATGFESWGFNARGGLEFAPSERVKLFGVDLLRDARDERITGNLAPIVSLPSLLSGLELAWTRPGDEPNASKRSFRARSADLARKTYRVQELRYQREKIITARSDHRIGVSPSYVVDSIFVQGYPWNTVSPTGDPLPWQALVATQVVFPTRVLWKTHYADVLTQNVDHLYQADKGWYEGRLERTGGYERLMSLRTNAMVLESLFYQLDGKIYHPEDTAGLFELWTRDPYKPRHECLKPDGRK